MVKTKEKELRTRIIFGVALALLFFLCADLYRKMALYPEVLDNYRSDVGIRLMQGGAGDSYSIFLKPIFLFHEKLGVLTGSVFIGVYLALFVIGTVAVVFLFLKTLCKETSTAVLAVFSFLCMFVIAIPLTFDSDLYTVYCGSVWHNESYIGMRFFAVLLLLFFYRKCNQYLNDFTVGDFFIECVLFLIVNWVKPNFTIAFAPAMLVMMIVDIIKSKGKGFVRWIMFGVPVLIGSLIFIYQYMLLFTNSGSGNSSEESHVIILWDYFINTQQHPFVYLVLGNAFPILVLLFHFREIVKSKFYLVCYLAWFFSLLEFVFLYESGPRMYDGNFSWGLQFFTFVLFCLSVKHLIDDLCDYQLRRKRSDKSKLEKCDLILGCEALVFSVHLYYGLVYFTLILFGRCGYWI